MKKQYIQPSMKRFQLEVQEYMKSGMVGSEQTSNPEDWNSNDGLFDTGEETTTKTSATDIWGTEEEG